MNLFSTDTLLNNSQQITSNISFLFQTIFGQFKSILGHVPVYVIVMVGIVGVILIILNLLKALEVI